MPTQTTRSAALEYAKLFPVFPCWPENKKPITTNGFHDASRDPSVVDSWWRKKPSAMIGTPLGEIAAAWVLDIDCKPGKPNGFLALDDWELEHGRLPDTLSANSPSGGKHYYFKWDRDQPVYNTAGVLAAGIDTRGQGGYVILPPSVSMEGTFYTWTNRGTPIAEAPDWLYAIIQAKRDIRPNIEVPANAVLQTGNRYLTKVVSDEVYRVRSCGEGSRNEALFKASIALGNFIAGGALAAPQAQAWLSEAASACGLWADDGDKACIATIASGFRIGAKRPRRAPEDPPPPSEADYGETVAKNGQDPVQGAPANGHTNGHGAHQAGIDDVAAALALLDRDASPERISAVLGLIERARPDPLQRREWYERIKQQTGKPIGVLSDAARSMSPGRPAASLWLKQVILSESGAPIPMLANTTSYLRTMGNWPAAFAFDEFNLRVELCLCPPWSSTPGKPYRRMWLDIDNLRLTEEIQRAGMDISDETVAKAVQVAADDNRYHPVRDWLNSLQWDGERRIDTWLSTYCGVDVANKMLVCGAKWLIGAVRRVFEPGCKFDSMLVLIGKGDIGKSLAFRILAGDDWFSDDMGDVGSKDAAIKLAGKWITEAGELASIRRAESNAFHAFVSRQVDNFRPPFGRVSADFPRQGVFAGTANDTEWITGAEAERRYWIFDTPWVDIDRLREDRDQLWAEALIRYQEGEEAWIAAPEVKEAAAKSRDDHTGVNELWLDKIRDGLGDRLLPQRVTSAWVLTTIMAMELPKCGKAEQTRVGMVMRKLGWRAAEIRGAKERRFYVPIFREQTVWRFEQDPFEGLI